MQLERIVSAGQLVPVTFFQDALAANQTDVQLLVGEVNAAAANAVDGYVMPFAGRILAVTTRLSAAATAGSLTVGPTINGTEASVPALSITTAQSARAVAGVNTGPAFSAGDLIGAEITTSGTWDGTGADLAVAVWVLLNINGR